MNNRFFPFPGSLSRMLALLLLPLAAQGVGAAPVPAAPPGQSDSFFAGLQSRAEILAAAAFRQESTELPPFLAALDYDQYRDIRYHPDAALWRRDGLPFQAQFFSRGFIFNDRVRVNVIDHGVPAPVEFAADLFDFGRLPVPETVPADLGFAGLRLHYPINVHNYFDEVIVFLGASYFRAVGRDEVFGLSARALALNTGLPESEEFPVFREFWLEKPDSHAKKLTLYALLDSPSVAGAYEFVIRPGTVTEVAVRSRLYFRADVKKLGVAPLTSMFLFGKSAGHFVDDFRPEVHDSDGLLIASGSGEWIWRPLNNPQRLSISAFQAANPRGFGLMQRERDFASYQDLEADYQRRPSAWIEPTGDWGEGTVELVEIPSDGEFNDNVVAFWVPAGPVVAGSARAFDYTLGFGDELNARPGGARAVATRVGAVAGSQQPERKFVVDFVGSQLDSLPPQAVVTADVTASTGILGAPVVQRNTHTGGYRVYFEFTPGEEPLAELRCALRSGSDYLSETWNYQWRREQY